LNPAFSLLAVAAGPRLILTAVSAAISGKKAILKI
jgi:hypothetical protein